MKILVIKRDKIGDLLLTTPLLALVWCGLWSMIYATRHQEPGERTD